MGIDARISNERVDPVTKQHVRWLRERILRYDAPFDARIAHTRRYGAPPIHVRSIRKQDRTGLVEAAAVERTTGQKRISLVDFGKGAVTSFQSIGRSVEDARRRSGPPNWVGGTSPFQREEELDRLWHYYVTYQDGDVYGKPVRL